MYNHTCQYCDGTLQSTRPLCMFCSHALCGEIIDNPSMGVFDYLFGLPRHIKVSRPQSTCPRCLSINILNANGSDVMSCIRSEYV